MDGNNAPAPAGQGDAVAIPEVERLVRSTFFEAYLTMIQTFSALILRLIAWAESCPCHWHLLTGGGSRAMRASTRRLLESCPMRGRRAPELAMNAFMDELTAFSQQGVLSLTLRFPSDLSEEDRSRVVQDFELGRSFLTTVFALKTSHFRSLPWSAAGLAHQDQERARELWSQLRTRYGTGETPEARSLRQQLPRLFEPCVLEQGDQWYFGADLSTCGDFAAELSALAFVPVAERRVESQHARTQKGSKKSPCHTAAYMSLQLRGKAGKDLRDELCGDPKGFIAKLAPCVNECRSYKMAVFSMRLGLHPAMRSSGRKSRNRQLRDALYRADLYSLRQRMPDVFVREAHFKDRPGGRPQANDEAAEASPLGQVLHQLALEHVLARLPEFVDGSAEKPAERVMFAVGYDARAFSLLREFLLPAPEQVQTPMLTYSPELMTSEAEAIVATSGRPARGVETLFQKLTQAETSDHRVSGVFFKLLPSMSRMKRFQGEGELRLCSSDIPIALLRPVSFDRSKVEFVVGSETLCMRSVAQGVALDDIPCVLSFSSMSLRQLKSLRVLKVNPNMVYCLRAGPDFSPPLPDSQALRALLQQVCVRGRAGLSDTSGLPAEQKALVQALQQNGLLTDDVPLQLTPRGEQYVCLANSVTEPRNLLVKLDVPVAEQSKWQLMQALQDDGWECRVCNVRQCHTSAPFDVMSADSAKVIFLVQKPSGIVCSRLYLLALTMAHEHLLPVPHGKANTVYTHILRGLPHLALPAPRPDKAFRAIQDGDEWLDHVPRHQPSRKKRAKRPLRRALATDGVETQPAPVPAIGNDDDDQGSNDPAEPDQPDAVRAVFDREDYIQVLEEFEDSEPEGDEEAVEPPVPGPAPMAVPVEAAAAASVAAAPPSSSHSRSSSASSSDSSSSSSSSSSDDGSSDSGAAAAAAAAAKPKATSKSKPKTKPKPKPKPKSAIPKAKAKASGGMDARAASSSHGGGGGGGDGGVLLPSTFFWRGCKFTALKGQAGEVTGYEATCKHPAHVKCRRSLKFSAHGGRDAAMTKLKWWLLQARYYANKDEHVGGCPHDITGAVPTEADLESTSFGFT